ADQGGDLVAVGDGALDEVAADAAGGSQNGDTHVVVPFAGRCLDVFESTAARAREPSPGRAGTYAIVSVRTAPAGVGAGWTRLSERIVIIAGSDHNRGAGALGPVT